MLPEDNPPKSLYKKEEIEIKLEKIGELEIEIKRLNSVVNTLHNKLNQLTNKFNAHRDRKDIHDKGTIM